MRGGGASHAPSRHPSGGASPRLTLTEPGDLAAVDRFGREPRFGVVLHLYSVAKKHRIRLYAGVPEEDPTLETLVPLWAGANWFEREAFDMYGIVFSDHPDLRRIPVVILTTSDAEQDIVKSYDLHANCYVTKPVDLDKFGRIVSVIEDFWLSIVKLPKH